MGLPDREALLEGEAEEDNGDHRAEPLGSRARRLNMQVEARAEGTSSCGDC